MTDTPAPSAAWELLHRALRPLGYIPVDRYDNLTHAPADILAIIAPASAGRMQADAALAAIGVPPEPLERRLQALVEHLLEVAAAHGQFPALLPVRMPGITPEITIYAHDQRTGLDDVEEYYDD